LADGQGKWSGQMVRANGLALDIQARINRTNGGKDRPPHP